MAVEARMTVAEVVANVLAGEPGDFVREAVAIVARELMEAEVSAEIGAGRGEVSIERLTHRNGYRPRGWETRVGEIELAIPRKRSGAAYFPSFLEPRRRSEQAIVAVVLEAYVNGVSTRKVDRLVEQLGIQGMSKDRVSALCRALDEQVEAFRKRPLEGDFPYLWLDAKQVKVRDGGHVRSKALVIAYAVHETGRREVIALDLGEVESEAFWIELLRDLRRRGLQGVRLCVSDQHEGLRNANRARDRLPDPPNRVGRELEAFAVVELLNRANQTERALLDQVEERKAAPWIRLRDRDDKAQVRLDHLRLRRPVAALDPLRQRDLLLGRQQRHPPDRAQVEPQRVERRLDAEVELRRLLLLGLRLFVRRVVEQLPLDQLERAFEQEGVDLLALLPCQLDILERVRDLVVGQKPVLKAIRTEPLKPLGVRATLSQPEFGAEKPRDLKIAVGAVRVEGVEPDPPRPAQDADVEVEERARIATSEEDREEGDDSDEQECDPEDDQDDVVRNREDPLDEPQPAAQLRIEPSLGPNSIANREDMRTSLGRACIIPQERGRT
jgi:hypothetical protein